ncbi:MAG: hypothetical protein JSV86_12660 [Gemmatimonadota bacterium]|nr:MAG: hypothetical protein JSV86_12660 [Gemmatimonadota bacterium]
MLERTVPLSVWSAGSARIIGVVILLVLVSQGAQAQSAVTASPPMDTTSLGVGPYARMHTLLEKTIFKVDVLTVDVWLGEGDTRRLEEVAAGSGYSSQVADSIAWIAIHSRDAYVRIEFVRDVSLDRFLGGVEGNLRLVPRAGIISEADYREISNNLPRWFAFLGERGISKGDRILYRIRGDELRTRYVTVDGEILLDQTDLGASARLSVLGSYFLDGSEFRGGLIGSLFGGE